MREKRKTSSGTFSVQIFSCLYYYKVIIRFFSFNLKLAYTCEFFKKLKLHSLKRVVQFQLFEKLTRAN